MKVVQIGVFLVLTILFTEYGFRFRQRAVPYLSGNWKWHGTLIRAALWAAAWRVIVADSLTPIGLALWAGTVVYGEGAVWLLRHQFRQGVAFRRPFGTVITHFFPLGAGAILTAVFFVTARVFGRQALDQFPGLPLGVTAAVTASIALFTWATLLTVSVVEMARSGPDDDAEGGRPGAGEVIGIMERLLVFWLVFSGAYTAAGFIMAAKAAARFPEFHERRFADYFLIGTLCSVGVATLGGMLVAAVWK